MLLLLVPLLALGLLFGSISDYATLDQSAPRGAIVEASEDLLFLGFAEEVAGSLRDERLNPEGQARKLVMWTHLSIRTQNTSPGLVVSDGAFNVVRRGYGYCDQSAQILASIAWALGWESRMWFLRDENGDSPHAVAEINWGDGWVLADPWLGLLGVNDVGNLVSVQELGNGGREYELSGYATAGYTPEQFENADEIVILPYSIEQGLLADGLLGLSQVAYKGVGWLIGIRESALEQLGGDLGISDPTLGILWPTAGPGTVEAPSGGGDKLTFDDNREAYLEALSRILEGDVSGAEEGIERALETYPESPWRSSLLYLRSLMNEELPDQVRSPEDYGSDIPIEARIRLNDVSDLTVGLESLTLNS